MKVVQQDSSRLTLRELNALPVVIGVLAIGLGAFLGANLLYIFYGLGVKTINCQRIESAVVNCSLKNSYFFGAIDGGNTTLATIKQAFLETETSTSNDGETVYKHRIALKSADTVVTIDTGFGYAGSFRAKDFTEKINAFLSSQQPNLELYADTRLDFENYVAIFLYALFLSILFLGGSMVVELSHFMISWEFDKLKGKAFYQHAKLLDALKRREKKKDYPLHAITSIEIHNAQDLEDSDSTPSYSINLVLDQDRNHPRYLALKEYGGSDLSQHQDIANTLGTFLHVPVSPEPVLTKQKNLIFQGKESLYTRFGSSEDLEKMPFQPVSHVAKALESLGFQPLGLLNAEAFSEVRIAGYAHASKNVYATIMFGFVTEHKTRHRARKIEVKILSQEFYTTFASGASLTTSTTPNVSDLREKLIFRSSFPGTNADELLKLHQQRMTELQTHQGEPLQVTPNLKSLAMAIDEYLLREARDP